MSDWRFLTPAYFELLKLVGLMAVFLVVVIFLKWFKRPRRSKNSCYRLFGPDWAWLLVLLLAVSVVVALAGPLISSGHVISQSGSIDVLVFIDNSFSMATRDLRPSRQELAKSAALNLVDKGILRPGDRAAVFVFGGLARWRMPLSKDFEDFRVKISEIGHPEVYQEESQLNTDFAYLLDYAVRSIDTQDDFTKSNQAVLNLKTYANNRIAFLFSDGNDESEGRLNESLRRLAQKKIKIYGIGVGTEKGGTVTIRAYDPDDPQSPSQKVTVKTKLQMKTLEKVSQATGGETFVFNAEDRQTKLESFMRSAVNASRSTLPRLIYSDKGREVWWEVLSFPAVLLFFLIIILAI